MAANPKSMKLTRRQVEVLQFIDDSTCEHGYPPTVREIGAHFDFRSPNGVVNHLVALTKKGYIQRTRLSRSITIIKPVPRDSMTVEIRVTCSRCGTKLAEDRIVYQVRAGALRHTKPAVDFCEPCYAAFQAWLARGAGLPSTRNPLPGQRDMFESRISLEHEEKF